MEAAVNSSPAFAAPGWDSLLEGLRREVAWSIARTLERMRTLPSFADLDEAALRPVVARNHDAVLAGLELRRRPRPSDVNDSFVRTGAERARQGVAASDMAAAWRIGQESLYLLASTLVDERADRDRLLREFLELVMSWVDFAMLGAAEGHRTTELSELRRLMQEQAALRRVATLVARERPPEEVLAKVAEEVGLLLGVESAWIDRYEPDSNCTVVASWGKLRNVLEVGSRWKLEGESASSQVHRTGRPVRFDSYEHAWGSIEAHARKLGLSSSVGNPILVNGRLWGAIFAATSPTRPMPADAESRISQFTDLVATAIANVQARSDLAESRARIVAAGDDERRRVVRDLHDGAQQRLVHTTMTLKQARRALDLGQDDATALLDQAVQHAEAANDELRELAHGILPSVLTLGGLRVGVRSLGARMSIPVETDVSVGRLPQTVEATAYFLVAEALTNVAKHARAKRAGVTAHLENDILSVEVSDDGIGGADPDGTGLVGLRDRLAALGGTLRIDSPVGGGTRINASVPVHRRNPQSGSGQPN